MPMNASAIFHHCTILEMHLRNLRELTANAMHLDVMSKQPQIVTAPALAPGVLANLNGQNVGSANNHEQHQAAQHLRQAAAQCLAQVQAHCDLFLTISTNGSRSREQQGEPGDQPGQEG